MTRGGVRAYEDLPLKFKLMPMQQQSAARIAKACRRNRMDCRTTTPPSTSKHLEKTASRPPDPSGESFRQASVAGEPGSQVSAMSSAELGPPASHRDAAALATAHATAVVITTSPAPAASWMTPPDLHEHLGGCRPWKHTRF